jgi:hypothetical protein
MASDMNLNEKTGSGSRRESENSTRRAGYGETAAKELKEKYEKLEGLLIHSLKVVEKLA